MARICNMSNADLIAEAFSLWARSTCDHVPDDEQERARVRLAVVREQIEYRRQYGRLSESDLALEHEYDLDAMELVASRRYDF